MRSVLKRFARLWRQGTAILPLIGAGRTTVVPSVLLSQYYANRRLARRMRGKRDDEIAPMTDGAYDGDVAAVPPGERSSDR